jgi:phosphotransferase system HPr-like phosphotransfer protein
MLAATQFTELKIIVEGGDEEAAIEALCALIEGECGEA